MDDNSALSMRDMYQRPTAVLTLANHTRCVNAIRELQDQKEMCRDSSVSLQATTYHILDSDAALIARLEELRLTVRACRVLVNRDILKYPGCMEVDSIFDDAGNIPGKRACVSAIGIGPLYEDPSFRVIVLTRLRSLLGLRPSTIPQHGLVHNRPGQTHDPCLASAAGK